MVLCGRILVTRGQGCRGPCRAQFRSAPSFEHRPRPRSSSSIARVRAARGLFEHGEAHRRACPRGCAFSPPPDGATCPLLGDLRLVAEADQGSPPVAPAIQGPSATWWRHVGAAPPAHGFSTRNVAKILPMCTFYLQTTTDYLGRVDVRINSLQASRGRDDHMFVNTIVSDMPEVVVGALSGAAWLSTVCSELCRH